MADQADVRRLALALPDAKEETGRFAFSVLNKGRARAFAWVWMERVEPKRARIPNDDVLAVRVSGEMEKQLLLSASEQKFFTEPHYNGFPAVLVRLAQVDVEELDGLLTNAWRCQAPRPLVRELDARADAASEGG